MQTFALPRYGISGPQILRNLSPAVLYEEAIRFDHRTSISATGALVAYSGEKTGRSPRDKRVVKQTPSQDDIWWGPVNFPLEPPSFKINLERAIDYLQTRERLYVVYAFACWYPPAMLRIWLSWCRPYLSPFTMY